MRFRRNCKRITIRPFSIFEKAILASQNDEKIKDYQHDIERCRMKQEILGKHNQEK